MAPSKTTSRKVPTMTTAHKAALAAGRDEARQVKAYLEALEATAPKRRGRRRTKDSIGRRLSAIDASMEAASALGRLQLLQEKTDLEAELATLETSPVDLTKLRSAFVKVARSYGERKGITYATWRAVGVDAATLKAAGIARS
jgi:hypothetical protein